MQLTLERMNVKQLYRQIEQVYLQYTVNIICYNGYYATFYDCYCCMTDSKRKETQKKAKDEFARAMTGVEFDCLASLPLLLYQMNITHICCHLSLNVSKRCRKRLLIACICK